MPDTLTPDARERVEDVLGQYAGAFGRGLLRVNSARAALIAAIEQTVSEAVAAERARWEAGVAAVAQSIRNRARGVVEPGHEVVMLHRVLAQYADRLDRLSDAPALPSRDELYAEMGIGGYQGDPPPALWLAVPDADRGSCDAWLNLERVYPLPDKPMPADAVRYVRDPARPHPHTEEP